MGRIYLSTYHPLVITQAGREAVKKHGIPPFVDASCRREPDLESVYPSISALCHADKFAPRLVPGDTVVYSTIAGNWLNLGESHWRIVAVLTVRRRFDSHKDAAIWYRDGNLPLPSNCLVPDNPPLSLDRTARRYKGPDKKRRKAESDADLSKWDLGYHARVRRWGAFLVCETLFCELNQPPVLTRKMTETVFDGGKMPLTLTPPRIAPQEFRRLIEACSIPVSR